MTSYTDETQPRLGLTRNQIRELEARAKLFAMDHDVHILGVRPGTVEPAIRITISYPLSSVVALVAEYELLTCWGFDDVAERIENHIKQHRLRVLKAAHEEIGSLIARGLMP